MNLTREQLPTICEESSETSVSQSRINAICTCSIEEMYFTGYQGHHPDVPEGPIYYLYGHAVVKNGPVVSVFIKNARHTIKMKAHNYDEVKEQLNLLCCSCFLPCGSCNCNPKWIKQPGEWAISTERGKKLPRSTGKMSNPRRYITGRFIPNKILLQGSVVSLLQHCNKGSTPDTMVTPGGYRLNPQNCKIQGMESIINSSENTYVKLFEDIGTLIHQWRRSRTVEDTTLAVGAFVRSVTGVSVVHIGHGLLMEVVNTLFSDVETQGPGFSTTVENMWNNYNSMKGSFLSKKILKVLNHVIAASVFHKLGIEWDPERYKVLEKEQFKPSAKDYFTMIDAVVDLVMYLLKTGRQYMITGNYSSFFIDGDTVGDWYTRASKLKKDFEFLSNPAAVGIELHTYLKNLRFCIEEGNCLSKSLRKDSPEWRLAYNLATDLQVCENKYMSIASALSMRGAPLGVVLYGSPGIGKSHITNAIANFYALRYGLDPSPEFRFQHSSEEEYFTNFKTYMHTIILDDVAQHRPDRVQNIDPSISALIKIFNNMPFSPPQAAIDDKGKTPLMCELGIVTTNVLDMNIPFYFSKSFAAMRRLNIHIEPIVKTEFRLAGSTGIDPSKTTDELYGEYWDFNVR